ncbi:MAG: hypothetical protein IJ809_00770 [Clostridia bacterium]|nr:hypothetical protein [Clostridia bacterium]
MKQRKERKQNNKKKIKPSILRWFITITIATFVLSLFFSYISTVAINDIPLVFAIILLLLVIFIGIFFDIIAVAVTVADEANFHAKATKKVEGSKKSIHLIKNAPKVSNVCADVIGDMCGVLSGSISAIIAIKITSSLNLDFNIQIFISAFVASLTVGGKAIGKEIANANSVKIVHVVGKFLHFFERKKNTHHN